MKKKIGRSCLDRVGDIADDHIIKGGCSLENLPSVGIYEGGPLVLESALMPLGKALLTELHHLGIQVHHHRRGHGLVGEDFSKRSPFTPTGNEKLVQD